MNYFLLAFKMKDLNVLLELSEVELKWWEVEPYKKERYSSLLGLLVWFSFFLFLYILEDTSVLKEMV